MDKVQGDGCNQPATNHREGGGSHHDTLITWVGVVYIGVYSYIPDSFYGVIR